MTERDEIDTVETEVKAVAEPETGLVEADLADVATVDAASADIVPAEASAQFYDFFKHTTTLALISIGGVLGLLQNERVEIPDISILMSLGSIGLSALVSLVINSAILGDTLRPKRSITRRQIQISQLAVVCLFVLGAGIFTGAFSGAI